MINPVQYYAKEPAPMGIADFGVTSNRAGASAYAYSSMSFQGEATVHSMSVTISGSSSHVTAFELNAVLLLQRDGQNFTYWIQNGLHLDASSDQYTIGGAYVWNFSSPSAKLTAGEVKGNASSVLSGDTYYFYPGCGASFAGECTTLSLPATLEGRIASSTSGGVPYVDYEYNIGSGWVTYDNVSFPHMAGANDTGFRVDGFTPTPMSPGLYYDAEWDWVGAGGGSGSVDQGSDIVMSLERWNGHNFQAVPTAWNFGSNTGETASNVTDGPATAGVLEPSAELTSGPGTLGLLYNLSTVGFVNLTIPTPAPATLRVDGGSVSFAGGWANLTLSAGTHSVYLEGYTNASASFVIVPGATEFVNLSGAGRLAFTETGLPKGVDWGVSLNGTRASTGGNAVAFNVPNGTYVVTYLPVPGYYWNSSAPSSVTLPGTTQVMLIYSVFTYHVTFSETGLPSSTPWWVNASGTRVQGTGGNLAVSAPNGSTPYEVGSLYEFVATPSSGEILVSDGIVSPVDVAFAYRPAFIDGIVTPAGALVTIGGLVQPTSGGAFNDSVLPGVYSLNVSAAGYQTLTESVTATPGNTTWANVTMTANATQPGGATSHNVSTSGSFSLTLPLLVVAGVVVVAIVALALIFRRRSSN